ncbi:MAG: ROK family protein [Candidatus Peribacteraceae bacterium]|nr:ROK family protein [Candidatus Peribacteraceae bacterium]
METVLGIDIGGTKVLYGLYDASTLELLRSERVPTERERGFAAVVDDVIRHASAWKRPDTVACGIGVPGLVSQGNGSILRIPNIEGGDGFPLRDLLSERLGMKVAVGNDSQCFALGEARAGAGKGLRVVVGVTMGTGVGGGIVIDGKLYAGADGCAGEIGHTLLVPGLPPYETDEKRGETEQFLSGTAMRKRCAAAEKPDDLLAGEACAFLHPHVVLETAWLCTNLTHFLNPSIIVFGGSTGRALRPFLPAIGKELARWTLPGTPLPSLAIRMLDDAATRGAAMLALDASPTSN